MQHKPVGASAFYLTADVSAVIAINISNHAHDVPSYFAASRRCKLYKALVIRSFGHLLKICGKFPYLDMG